MVQERRRKLLCKTCFKLVKDHIFSRRPETEKSTLAHRQDLFLMEINLH
jgi:hypothetical protein